jgi:LacI family transcriptional regulator
MMATEAPKTAEKPTLKTISRLAGLAVPTVSRALNDAPDIGAETKRLVRRIADDIGYVPNRAGVRLRTGRTNVISLVLSTEHDMMTYTSRLIGAVAGALRGTPYHMIITPYFPTEDLMRPIRYIVETGSADAIIFNQTEPRDPRIAWLLERGFPFATHGRSDWADRHPWFDYDNVAFASLGIRRLVARGRREIALVAPPMSQNYAQNILAGATAAAKAQGARISLVTGASSDDASDHVRAAMTAHLKAHPGTDGLLCASTSSTMASVAALESAGHVVGGDIDVVSKEAVPFLNLFRPGIMALSEDVARAGEFLARAAIQAIRNPERPPLQGLEVPEDRF